MKKWVIFVAVTVVGLAAVMAMTAPDVSGSRGQTSACQSCHTYPSTSIQISTDVTSMTVAPRQAFTVNITWTGGNTARNEINWPNYANNTAFSPTPRIPYSGNARSGNTSSVLTAPAALGTYTVRVYAALGSPRQTDYQDISVTVAAPANAPPVLASIGNRSVTAGQALQFTISAADPNGDPLTYSASNLPAGATFTPITRTFAWTPASAGTYSNVTFQVSDGSLTDSEAITITVNPAGNSPPVLDPIGNKSVTAGQTLQFTVSATDPDGDPLAYSASNLPSGATFTPATRTFSWTPSSAAQAGAYPNVTFQVSDGSLTDSETVTITVSAAGGNSPPVLHRIGNKLARSERTHSFTVFATDPDGDTLTYSAYGLPPGASFSTSTRTFSWRPDEEDEEDVFDNVRFQVSDGSFTVSETIAIEVTENTVSAAPVLSPIGDKTLVAGQVLEFTVWATDANSNPLTYSASSLPAGATFNTSTRTFSWTPTSAATYANIRFQVSDGSLTDFENVTIAVTASNGSPVLNSIGNKSIAARQLLQFTISAADPDGDPLTYSASNLPPWATFTPGTRTFSWTPTSAGTFSNVTFQVSDGSLTDSETITIDVTTPANSAPVLAAIGNKSAVAGQALQFTISATDPDGDPLTYSASNLPAGATFTPITRTFAWTPASAGTYSNVTFQVSDGSLTDSEAITITVNPAGNSPPVLDPIGNKSVTAGKLLQFTVYATDPNGDPLAYSASNLPPGASFSQTGSFSWTPSAAQIGVYQYVHFEVTDGKQTVSQNITITVNPAAPVVQLPLPPNSAPVLSPIGHRSATIAQPLQFTVWATDPDNDPLSYSASNLPPGASFNPATRSFTWTPTSTQSGSYPDVRFQVSDGKQTATEDITITVEAGDARPPDISSVSAAGATTRSVTIHWTTDEPSTSQVEYWGSPRQLSPLNEDFATAHSVQLTGLASGTLYRYRTLSVDKAGNLAASPEHTFVTPGAFTVSELRIEPAEAGVGEQVTISALVTNNADEAGSHELTLRIGSAREAITSVDLAPGARQRVTFTTTRFAPGSFQVDVNGATGTLLVLTPPPRPARMPVGNLMIGATLVVGAGTAGILLRRRRDFFRGSP